MMYVSLYSPLLLLTLIFPLLLFSINILTVPSPGTGLHIVSIFSDETGWQEEEGPQFNNLVLDKNTGRVYIGAVNQLYQLSPNLEQMVRIGISSCSFFIYIRYIFDYSSDGVNSTSSLNNTLNSELISNDQSFIVVQYWFNQLSSLPSISALPQAFFFF